MKKLRFSFIHLLLNIVLMSGLAPLAFGQNEGHYSTSNTPGRGYWNLKTDYVIHGTVIRFYAPDSQLVYQELLPNRLVKLTPGNIRRLDQTLYRLVTNRLVASDLQVSLLLDEAPVLKRPARNKTEMANSLRPEKTALMVNYYRSADQPMVHLVVGNPTLERVTISILNTDKNSVYEHITHLAASRHHLNFTDMAAGTYQIRVQTSTRQYQQSVTVAYSAQYAVVQLNETESSQTPAQTISLK